MTSFQEKVYRIAKKIKKGRVMTYKQVAEAIGHRGAFRAVGNALNKNPDIKHVPCHRVIKSDGSVGNHRYGTRKKLSLLKREGVLFRNGKVVL